MVNERVSFIRSCAICGKDVSTDDTMVTLNVYYRPSGFGSTRAHADCIRPFLSERAKEFLDPDKLATENQWRE
jgi:endogenous inhibitor of DNA gyrase (YacG/DUF329 family)